MAPASGNSSSRIVAAPIGNWSSGLGTGWTDRASIGSWPATPAFSGVTEKPAMSIRPQAAPMSGQKLSCTAPEPTMAKSSSHACWMTGWYSVIAASCWLTSICLPLMPPAALHHSAKAVAGVEDLLVQAGAALEAGIGDRAER